MIRTLFVGILSPKSLASHKDARQFIDLLCSVYPDLTPEKYGYYEPLRTAFDPSNIEPILVNWDNQIFWKRRRPRSEGTASVPDLRHPKHAWVNISIDAERSDIDGLMEFVQQASVHLEADFAYLHLMTEGDVPVAQQSRTGMYLDRERGKFYLGVTTHQLKNYIPQLYWATIFGSAYIKHFGKERILSAPAPVVKELSDQCIYLQMSNSPFDLESDFDSVDKVRKNIMAHLNKDSFFNPEFPEDHVYNVPEFEFLKE